MRARIGPLGSQMMRNATLCALFMASTMLLGLAHMEITRAEAAALTAETGDTHLRLQFFSLIKTLCGVLNYGKPLMEHGENIADALPALDLRDLAEAGVALKLTPNTEALVIRGSSAGDGYQFSLGNELLSPPELRAYGDLLVNIQLRRNAQTIIADAESTSVFLNTAVASKEANPAALAAHLTQRLRELDGSAPTSPTVFASTREWLSQFAKELQIKQERRSSGHQTYTHLSYRVLIDMEKLEERYPKLAHYVAKLLTKMNYQATFLDASERELLTVTTGKDGEARVVLEMASRDGAIVPLRADGKPELAAALKLSDIPNGTYFVDVEGAMQWTGLTITLEPTRLRFVHSATKHGSEFVGRLMNMPKVVIDGWFLYVVPIWDWQWDPAQSAPDTMKVLTHGNDGRGLEYTIGATVLSANESYWYIDSSMELLDSFFRSFITDPIVENFPDKDEREDLAKFGETLSSLAMRDLTQRDQN